jgi:RNA polymerase sigma-70 factor (ECF subfamily)
MTSRAGTPPERLLRQARDGDVEALGRLLESYRNYLGLLARSLAGPNLWGRLDHSDLVQETFLNAHRRFAQFQGDTEPELAAWLRQILAHNLANQFKKHRRQGRNHRREESLESMLDRSHQALQRALATRGSSPSAQAARREQAVLLADAVAALPADYRDVFQLRSMDRLAWDKVAAQMGRSEGAVKMLWKRAMVQLNEMLQERP